MSNQQIRDTVFRDYFNDPVRLLSLGNALLGTDYKEPSQVIINTLEGSFYSNIKNDVSFLLGGHWIVLVEHQTTINLNMPLRFLLYISELFKKHVAAVEKRLYGAELIPLPSPEFYVFYDGKDTDFDHKVLRLSDAISSKDCRLELVVHCYNLNYGKCQQLKERCRYLQEYSIFSNIYKQYRQQGYDILHATRLAVQYCKENDVMKDYIPIKESEVINMFGFEWNEDEYRKYIMEESEARGEAKGKAIGQAIGQTNGIAISIKNLMKNMNLSAEKAMEALGISKDEYSKYMALL